jgi:hypothetical protein
MSILATFAVSIGGLNAAHPAGLGGAGVDAVSVWRSVCRVCCFLGDGGAGGLLVGDGLVLGAGGERRGDGEPVDGRRGRGRGGGRCPRRTECRFGRRGPGATGCKRQASNTARSGSPGSSRAGPESETVPGQARDQARPNTLTFVSHTRPPIASRRCQDDSRIAAVRVLTSRFRRPGPSSPGWHRSRCRASAACGVTGRRSTSGP